MALGEIYLGVADDSAGPDLLSAFGRTFTTANRQLRREKRTASGKLRRDIIATKKTFTLAYNLIDGADLQDYKDLYDEDAELLLRVYTGAVSYDDFTVLMEPIDFERVLMFDNGLYSGVTIVLVEV